MFRDLDNKVLVGRAARKLKAMRQRDIKRECTSNNLAVQERSDVLSHLYA